MKKKVLLRSLIGAPIGVAISYIITVIISLFIGDGNYYVAAPQLVIELGGEMNAVLAQTIGSIIFGAACGGGAVIWEMENWSLLKMTVMHLIVISVSTFPIAYMMHWIPHNLLGIVIYCAVFFSVYAGIWLSIYFSIKKSIKKLNREIKSKAND